MRSANHTQHSDVAIECTTMDLPTSVDLERAVSKSTSSELGWQPHGLNHLD